MTTETEASHAKKTEGLTTITERIDPEKEEISGLIYFQVIRNDNGDENLKFLTALKNIFQKQLPKMPKEYISRLVYDRHHESLIIVRRSTGHVIGGITFHLFPEGKFCEIVFCAISNAEQVKGYGAFMMNYLKEYVKKIATVEYFLTYADNYAIGYFKKQGFSKVITLDKAVWGGKIKDYDGGTLMECKFIPKINYRELHSTLELQKQTILEKLKEKSNSHIIYPGLKFDNRLKIPIKDIPVEAGWTSQMRRDLIKPEKSTLYEFLRPLLTELQEHPYSWPFLEPVNTTDVPDYLSVIKHPIDLKTIDSKLEADEYQSLESFKYDVELIFRNCRCFNQEHSPYYKCANTLEQYYKSRLDARLSRK